MVRFAFLAGLPDEHNRQKEGSRAKKHHRIFGGPVSIDAQSPGSSNNTVVSECFSLESFYRRVPGQIDVHMRLRALHETCDRKQGSAVLPSTPFQAGVGARKN